MDSPRIVTERIERETLSKYAALSENAGARALPDDKCDIRTEYQRDRDRIIHCKAFRRLKHKTQVFLAPEGDHYRTRLTHTLEVSQIARTIARALRLNEDLTEAIALGHDLGHTPFGHAGEKVLDSLCEGGFRHYEQSVRICEKIEKSGRGLNLTPEVLDGIACHTGGEEAGTLEGRLIRLADKIAYINHDIDDAVCAGVLSETDIPKPLRDVFGESHSKRIDTMISSVINNSADDIKMDAEAADAFRELHEFMYSAVYLNPVAKSEESKVDGFITALFEHFSKNPESLPGEFVAIAQCDGTQRAVMDYIAGMTDYFAINKYTEVFIPKGWER